MDFNNINIVPELNGVMSSAPTKDFIRFETRERKNEFKSRQEGRTVYDSVDFVIIQTGGTKNTNEHEMKGIYLEKYALEYAKYKLNKEQPSEGTSLEMWGILSPGQRAEMKYYGIRTVEQLAQVADTGLQNLGPGARKFREMARDFVSMQEGAAPLNKLRSEHEELKKQFAMLQKNFNEIAQRSAIDNNQMFKPYKTDLNLESDLEPVEEQEIIEAPKKRRGRPKKTQET